MLLPKARGELSEAVFSALRSDAPLDGATATVATDDADLQITLWAAYELHYGGFEDVDDAREWDPDLLALRVSLERDLEHALRDDAPEVDPDVPVEDALEQLVADDDGASVAQFVRRHATREQVLELLRHRSIYHLKESDPVEWVVPRLAPVTKAALVELQYDEYGGGDPRRLHAHLFARGMDASGLRADPGAYVDEVPVEVLVQNNAMSLFGLHRRLRGAALGHLAAFEATSSLPSRAMAQGLERLGFPDEMIGYYTEHVEADAVHEQLAIRTICGSLVAQEPALLADVLLGAHTCLRLEDRYARRMLTEWAA